MDSRTVCRWGTMVVSSSSMAAPKGHPRYGGRAKGTPNKRTWDARALAERLGVDPLEILLNFAKGDYKALGYNTATKTVVDADGNQVQVDRIDEGMRQKAAKDAAPFIWPQLKGIELSGDASSALAATLTQIFSGGAQGTGNNASDGDDGDATDAEADSSDSGRVPE